MKRHLVAACLLALPLSASAQTAVPGTITFQGKVADASGALVGATTPVNRVAIFRIYDHATSTAALNRLYSEQQTVTISNGEFNVLVGSGTAVSGETNATALDGIFTGATRYLGVTVDDGTTAADPEITPRQQIVTTPFAFRAKVAESVVGGAGLGSNVFQSSGNVGIGTGSPAAPLTLFSGASDAKFLLQTPASGTGAADGLALIQSNAGYLFQYEALPLHLGTNATTRLTVAADGKVGIGITTPGALLSLGSALANTKLALWDDAAGSFYGMGIQASQFRFHTAGTGERFSFLGGANGNEVFTIKSTGQVGIGITTPIVPLQIYTADASSIMLQHAGTGTTLQSGLALIESNKGYLWQYANLPLLIGTNGTTRMAFTADGKVAIGGGENPGALLSLGGSTANTKLALWDNEAGGMYGLGMGGNQLRFHTNSAADRFSFLSDAAGTSEVFTIKSSGFVGTYSNLPLRIGTNNTERISIGTDGQITVNHPTYLATDASETFTIRNLAGKGSILSLANTAGSHIIGFQNTGQAYKAGGSTSSWDVVSDARLKQDVKTLSGSLDQLMRLRGVTFVYKDQVRHRAGPQTGFIAQEVETVFPTWVTTGDDGMKSLGPQGFEAHTVQALRELRAEKDTQLAARDRTIAAQDARIRDLEAQTKAADARMAAFERKLGALSLAAVTANSPR